MVIFKALHNFRILHSTRTPQIPTQHVCKLLSYPLYAGGPIYQHRSLVDVYKDLTVPFDEEQVIATGTALIKHADTMAKILNSSADVQGHCINATAQPS